MKKVKAKPSQPRSRPSRSRAARYTGPLQGASSDGDADVIAVDFSETEFSSLEHGVLGGSLPQGEVRFGALILGTNESARTKQFLPAIPGSVYRVEFSVRGAEDSTNDASLTYFVGPLVLDRGGVVLKWWRLHEPLRVADGVINGVADVLAPEGAVSVHLGFSGPRAIGDAPASNGKIAFLTARLYKLRS